MAAVPAAGNGHGTQRPGSESKAPARPLRGGPAAARRPGGRLLMGGDLILGLDPGTAATGWGIIEVAGSRPRLVDCGTVTTSARDPESERLLALYRGVQAVIDDYSPAAAAIEELFGGANLKAALSVGQARGVIILACAERGIHPAGYTPLRIKQAVVGYGQASKGQVQQMVKSLLGLDRVPRPDHAADALGVAICHAHSRRTEAKLGIHG